MNTEFFLLFTTVPWAGPIAKNVDVPQVSATDGIYLGPLEKTFKIDLEVSSESTKKSDFPPLDIHEGDDYRLFSKEFISVLDDLGVDNIEYHSAEVTYTPTHSKLDYKVANILSRIDALDRSASECTLDPFGNIMHIEKLVLDINKIKDHKIFWIREFPLIMVAHKSIKEAVEEKGLTGFYFVSDEDYEPGMI